jgi:hypothetical protein
MEKKEFDAIVDSETAFFILAVLATCTTCVGGVLMYAYRVFRWYMIEEARRKMFLEILCAIFFFPIYLPVKIGLSILKARQAGALERNQRHAQIDQARVAAREERKRLAALPKPKTKEEEVTELRADYEAAVQQIHALCISEDTKSDILEHLELKFVDDLMGLMG